MELPHGATNYCDNDNSRQERKVDKFTCWIGLPVHWTHTVFLHQAYPTHLRVRRHDATVEREAIFCYIRNYSICP